ncbi:MAG: hypothetical protein EA408_05970 [Marinilabiliales bacterium]|nr:MAG: hypothetical protein EA408_05970 [Marinilabiliales bacterium]
MLTNQTSDTEDIYNREIVKSLRYAGMIQRALLPSAARMERILGEHFTLFMPKDVVSGDFYWVSRKGKCIFVVAADCTGHGVPGALMSILGISFLNEVVKTDCTSKPNRILNKLREKIMEALNQTGDLSETKDGMDLSMCIIDCEKQELQFSGANNPLYLIRDNELIEIKPDKMPVGVNAVDEEPFSNNIINISRNDRIYMFTDGFPDQFGGPKGKKFKYGPFKNLLLDIHQREMKQQLNILTETIADWMGGTEQIDDILVLGFSIT